MDNSENNIEQKRKKTWKQKWKKQIKNNPHSASTFDLYAYTSVDESIGWVHTEIGLIFCCFSISTLVNESPTIHKNLHNTQNTPYIKVICSREVGAFLCSFYSIFQCSDMKINNKKSTILL